MALRSPVPRLTELLAWTSIVSFLLIGIESLFLTGWQAQLLARVLVIVGVASAALAKRRKAQDSSSFAIEASAVVSLLAGLGLMYVVFWAPPDLPHRKLALLASTFICAISCLVGELLAARQTAKT